MGQKMLTLHSYLVTKKPISFFSANFTSFVARRLLSVCLCLRGGLGTPRIDTSRNGHRVDKGHWMCAPSYRAAKKCTYGPETATAQCRFFLILTLFRVFLSRLTFQSSLLSNPVEELHCWNRSMRSWNKYVLCTPLFPVLLYPMVVHWVL